ncbi:MAG TPA: glycosyltransferase family 1 protein [Pseudomonadales bacterium]|nr:glycosyltransferase family 1 protein [Pseudomonadales bacterium]
MRILFVTDAWRPQTNGVVTTLEHTIRGVEAMGHRVEVLQPGRFRTLGLPGYGEIRLAIDPFSVGRQILDAAPDAVHIATEGPLGFAARRFLKRHCIPFTTSLHTKFPEYVQARTGLPLSWGYAFLRRFHRPARATLVTTATQRDELAAWGLEHLTVWGRGVDTAQFRPRPRAARADGPVLLYVGRLAVEKNVEAFLATDVPGHKLVVGDGPQRQALEKRFPAAEFVGYQYGDALAEYYARGDVFVFPSRTDTFGLVMLEAMACGTPVAAYPVTGPRDVVVDGVTGALDADLGRAIERALTCRREDCRAFAEANSWTAVARTFMEAVTPWRLAPVDFLPAMR